MSFLTLRKDKYFNLSQLFYDVIKVECALLSFTKDYDITSNMFNLLKTMTSLQTRLIY